MEKIDIKKLSRESGMAMDDMLRDGVAPTHDRLKVAAIILTLVNTVNILIEKVEVLEGKK